MKRTWTDTQLLEAVKSSKFYSDVAKKLNLKRPNKTLFNKIEDLKLDVSHFEIDPYGKRIPQRIFTKEILIQGSRRLNCSSLRRILLKENLLENKCQICDLGPCWAGKNLVLQIDHINGVNTDNRLENLRFLCPNCHSQTPSFCRGRKLKYKRLEKFCLECNKRIQNHSTFCIDHRFSKKKNIEWPKNLLELTEKEGVVKIAKLFGVTRGAVYHQLRIIRLGKYNNSSSN